MRPSCYIRSYPTNEAPIVISCHLGKVLRYDTVTKLGWSVSTRNHPISVIIESLLAEDWEADVDGEGRQVPPLEHEDDCVVCSFSICIIMCILILISSRIAFNGNMGISSRR